MELREMVRVGVKSLVRHKLRTLLTMLGVIFGVAAVISMMSIGEGARRAAIEQIKLLGTNNIRVKQAERSEAQQENEASPSEGLSIHDARALVEKLPTVTAVSPLRFVDETVHLGSSQPEAVKVVGVAAAYAQVTNAAPTWTSATQRASASWGRR